MPRVLLSMLILVAGVLAAEPRFRADDGNLWRLADNPALSAVSGDGFSVGTAYSPQAAWNQGAHEVQLLSPFFSFQYGWEGANKSTLSFGMAMGPWEGVSVGYRRDAVQAAGASSTTHNFGALWRPFDALSAAVTVDDAFGPKVLWGAGLGVRPLTVFWPGADWLTLTADGRWNGSIEVERWGGRLSWRGSDLRLWYEPATGTPGLEATVTWGAAEASLSPTRVGAALRWTSQTPDVTPWGPVILKIEGRGTLTAGPTPVSPWTSLLGGSGAWSLPALTDLLDRAAESRAVTAVVFVDPPRVSGLADAQTLALAVGRLKAAGKKVYIHADDFSDSAGYQGWQTSADRLSLDPSGSVGLAASGMRRFYLKALLDSVGIQFYNFAPWETKSYSNTLTFPSMPDGERAMVQRYLGDLNAQAAEALAAGRGARLRQDAAALVAAGPYLVGSEALDKGLVDALENRADFFEWLQTTHPGATMVDTIPRDKDQSWGPTVTRRTVALVHLSGDIVLGAGQAGRSIGRAAVDTLAGLRDDSSVQAVVLRVDSPGGAVLPSDALADQVKKTVAAGKPVLVVMGDVAASGGYYLAAPATRIWARPGTITGSIGVTAALFTAPEALKRLGIQPDGVDPAPSAGFGDWTRAPSEADKARWNAVIQYHYQRFLDVVAAGRGLSKIKLEPLARGQVYTGREALALGLVDALGGQEDAQAWLEDKLGGPIAWREYLPGQTAPFGGLLGPLAAAAVPDSPTLRLAASLDRWVGPAAEALEGVTARGPGPQVWFEGP